MGKARNLARAMKHNAARHQALAAAVETACRVPFNHELFGAACSRSAVRDLQRHGFSVVDGAVTAEWCSAARAEVLAAKRVDIMGPNHTHIVQPKTKETHVVRKPGIFELDLALPHWRDLDTASTLPHLGCDMLHDASRILARELDAAAPHLGIGAALDRRPPPLKLQLNDTAM